MCDVVDRWGHRWYYKKLLHERSMKKMSKRTACDRCDQVLTLEELTSERLGKVGVFVVGISLANQVGERADLCFSCKRALLAALLKGDN